MPSLFDESIAGLAAQLCAQIAGLPLAERVEALNAVRRALHQVSPFAGEPVDLVEWVPADLVTANDYNPNHVAGPELRLLERSIKADGYTQPIVGWSATDGTVETVDGFHRGRVGKEKPAIRQRVHGYLPVTRINADRSDRRDRMAATIRHNRARGVHGVAPMTDLVAELIRRGWEDSAIAAELGMDADEILRFKQTKGIAALFADHDFSRAWE